MSEFKIVTPEEAENADPIPAARKRELERLLNDGLQHGEREFLFRTKECVFLGQLAAASGWDVDVFSDPAYAPRSKMVLAPASKQAAA